MREFDGHVSEYVQGYTQGYRHGYAAALREISARVPAPNIPDLPKPIKIWYDSSLPSTKSDTIIDNALCPTCGAEANAACRGCED